MFDELFHGKLNFTLLSLAKFFFSFRLVAIILWALHTWFIAEGIASQEISGQLQHHLSSSLSLKVIAGQNGTALVTNYSFKRICIISWIHHFRELLL